MRLDEQKQTVENAHMNSSLPRDTLTADVIVIGAGVLGTFITVRWLLATRTNIVNLML